MVIGEKGIVELVGKQPCKLFEMSDLGMISSYLGVHYEYHDKYYHVDQREMIKNVIEKFNLIDAKACNIPLANGARDMDSDVCDNSVPYREAIGSLMYIATMTRPDIMFAV